MRSVLKVLVLKVPVLKVLRPKSAPSLITACQVFLATYQHRKSWRCCEVMPSMVSLTCGRPSKGCVALRLLA